PVAFVGLLLIVYQHLVTFALARLLAAYRAGPLPPPADAGDRSAAAALRAGVRLWRPAVSYAGIQLLVIATALLGVLGMSSLRINGPDQVAAAHQARLAALAALPLAALVLAFVQLVPQRVA